MPELLAPGVFIQEVPFGPQPIEGVSTSTAGFVGRTMWGPSSGAVLVTSFPDFQRKFGSFLAPASEFPLPHAMRGFFDNGGRRAYVARAVNVPADPVGTGPAAGEAWRASLTVTTGDREIALKFPVWLIAGASVRLPLPTVVGLAVGPLVPFSVIEASSGTAVSLEITAVDRAAGTVTATVDAGLAAPITARPETHFVRTGSASGVPEFSAKYLGSYGNRVQVLLEPVYGRRLAIESVATNVVRVKSTHGFAVGDRVELTDEGSPETLVTLTVDAVLSPQELRLSANPSVTTGTVALIEWRLTVTYEGAVVETITRLSSNPTRFAEQVAEDSDWIDAEDADITTGIPRFAGGRPAALRGGEDGDDPDFTVYTGLATTEPTGLGALERIDRISLLATPGKTEQDVIDAMISQAERLQDRFVVCESEGAADDIAGVLTQRGRYNSQYAAMYYPWVRVRDPLTREVISLPPSGHVLGCYARTDNDRGVWKAPANVTMRGILGLSVNVTMGEQEVLNPEGINALRDLDGLGNVIWGARTITADTLWRYVSVRRLFIFIEQSIIRGTRWAVFEPNDTKLWKRIDDSVTNFLTTVWREGGLFGEEPEQAFFVKVDETTTTQDDRDNGRVNILVGIAPVKPAEFVVFRIGQAPTSVILEESA